MFSPTFIADGGGNEFLLDVDVLCKSGESAGREVGVWQGSNFKYYADESKFVRTCLS